MHDATFAAATRPARFAVLGLPMLPYSIGHELLLLSKGNPILFDGFEKLNEVEQCRAVIQAVLICSRDWQDNQKPHRWLRLWRWMNRKANYPLAIADFKNYRAAGSLFPPVPDETVSMMAAQEPPDENKKGRELGSPYMARLYSFVAAMPEREISIHGKTPFDFPFGFANFLYLTSMELDGAARIENRKEAEVAKEFEEHKAAFAKEDN